MVVMPLVLLKTRSSIQYKQMFVLNAAAMIIKIVENEIK